MARCRIRQAAKLGPRPLGTLAGLAIELFATFVTTPALSWLTGVPPDLSTSIVVGNARALLFFLVLNWTLFAIGEELAFADM